MKVGIIGLGKVGSNLAYSLHRVGITPVGIYNRNNAKSEIILRNIKALAKTDLYETIMASDLIFITVNDNSISKIADTVSDLFVDKDTDLPLLGKVFLHMSGSMPSTLLSPLRKLGASVGSMHPIQTFNTDSEVPEIFQNICFGVEGDKLAVETAESIAEIFDSAVSKIDTEAKPYYHMACCFASNYMCVLMDIAGRLLSRAGFNEYGIEALTPLIEQTLMNILETHPMAALTGPIARGDGKTVQKHINALNESEMALADVKGAYQLLGLYALGLGFERGNFDEEDYCKLYDILMEIENDGK